MSPLSHKTVPSFDPDSQELALTYKNEQEGVEISHAAIFGRRSSDRRVKASSVPGMEDLLARYQSLEIESD